MLDIIRIKGTYINPTTSNLSVFGWITNSITITSYEDNIPWIIDGVDDYVSLGISVDSINIELKNGIINSICHNNHDITGSIIHKNMLIYNYIYMGFIDDIVLKYYGCTFNNISNFIFSEYYTSPNNNLVQFTDCVFINSTISDNDDNYGTIRIDNCTTTDSFITLSNAISATTTEGTTQLIDNDYDWYPTNYNENNEVVSGEKIGSRHRHGICDNCNSWFCEEGNPR
jgi:hypothetical protein